MRLQNPIEEEVERALVKLEKQIKNFRIIGPSVQGSFETGFVIGGESEAPQDAGSSTP